MIPGIWYIVGIYTTFEVVYSEVGGKFESSLIVIIKRRYLAISMQFYPLIAEYPCWDTRWSTNRLISTSGKKVHLGK